MTPLLHPDVNLISHSVKEAVSSAILHQTYDRLRGAGDNGRFIYREKPAKVLHTQNLLPRRRPSATASSYLEKDDVTSPAHIGTLGLTFQIADLRDKSFTIAARCCIYVRILPSSSDLSALPVRFRISKRARSIILRRRREFLRDAQEENKAALGDDGRSSPLWPEIKKRAEEAAQKQALVELGVSPAGVDAMPRQETLVSAIDETDEAPGVDDPSAQDIPSSESESPDGDAGPSQATAPQSATESAADELDALNSYEFVVSPGAPNAPPEVLVEKEHVPHKWVRLPVDLGSLKIDLSRAQDAVDRAIADFNECMVKRVNQAIDTWQEDSDSEAGGLLWRFPAGAGTHTQTVAPADVVSWDQTLVALRTNRAAARPAIHPVLEVENLDDPLHPQERTIRIILANESDCLDPNRAEAHETDATLYQVELSVSFDDNLHRPIALERIEPSYRYNRFLTHDALGINCGVRRRRLAEANVLETTALPIYFQPLIRQFQMERPPDFAQLGAADGGLPILKSLLKAYDEWLAGVVASRPYENALDPIANAEDLAREKHQFDAVDLPRWKAERQGLARGISILERAAEARESGKAPNDPSVLPLTAWRFMNQTFQRFWAKKNATVSSWRLFQISFILSQIAPIVSRLPYWKADATAYSADDDVQAALLYFSTGGGKSESFFGLLVFALAFDRLRGKLRGVTASIRYPLRLLTSQQADRLSQVLAAAAETRWDWQDHGFEIPGRGFEIGFWVGGNNTPNNPNARGVSDIPRLQDDWDELSHRHGDYVVYLRKWSRLPSCPFCKGSLTGNDRKARSTIGLRRFAEGHQDERLGHFCFNPQCEWNRRHHAERRPAPLPIHIMDSDIYAHAPAILLGTVDKLALIGQSARTIIRVLGMFGFAAWHHPASDRLVSPNTREQFRKGPALFDCEPLFPFYCDGEKLFFDPYPLLEVQDEAHLLDESLGTFSGLFETTFHHALRTLAPLLADQIIVGNDGIRAPRIVAASATVTEPERQIDQLYQRSAVLFPQPGPDLYENFYARLHPASSGDLSRDSSWNPEHRTPTRRRYVSLMTNGRTHTAATVAVLSAFHLTISVGLKSLIEGDDQARWQARQEMAASLPDDVFRNGHRAALLNPNVSHAEIAAALDLNRIALLYVTNKKGGDNVKAALQDIVRRDHKLAGYGDIPGVKTALITGAIDAGLIGAIVNEAASRPPPGTAFSLESMRDALRCVIATSAISHGVDVDEFNVMFFAGQPADIAEYIQASSRVGRTHVGTSILIPTPQQRRDRYVVEIHDIFHRFLERMIHAAPVERWAENAIDRTLASFLQLKICGVDYIRQMSAASTAPEKARLAEPDNVGEIAEQSRNNHIGMLQELRTFVVEGIGLYHETSPLNKQFYEQRISELFDRATTAMEKSNWKSETLENFFRQSAPPLARPMTSLRDVSEAGLIEGGVGTGADRINRADLGRVMSALLRGNNIWSSGETGG